MAGTQGHTRIETNRHFDDYASMKQHFRNARLMKEFIISGYDTTAGAVAEIDFSADIATIMPVLIQDLILDVRLMMQTNIVNMFMQNFVVLMEQ